MNDTGKPPAVEPDSVDPALVSVIAGLPRPSAPEQLVARILAQVPMTAQDRAIDAERVEHTSAPPPRRLGMMAAGGTLMALVVTLLVIDLPVSPDPRVAVTRSSEVVTIQAAQDNLADVDLASAGNAGPTAIGRSTSRPRATAKIPQIRASRVLAASVSALTSPEGTANGPPELAQAWPPVAVPADHTTPTYGPPKPDSEEVQFVGTEDAAPSPPSSQPEYGFRGREGP